MPTGKISKSGEASIVFTERFRAAVNLSDHRTTRAGLRADHLLDQDDLEGLHVWAQIVRAIRQLHGIELVEKDMRH